MTYALSPEELTPDRAMTENLHDMTEFQRELTQAALGVRMVFRRGKLFLSERYEWVSIPHAFQWWEADRLQNLFNQWKDAPTHYVTVKGNAVDLDVVEWIAI